MAPLIIISFCFATILFILTIIFQTSKNNNYKLPPGKTVGWPIIGETLSYFACPGKFIRDRMTKYSPNAFRSSLVLEKMVFLCGPLSNKFVFSNDGKLFKYWLPNSVAKLLSQPKYPENSQLWLSWERLNEPINKFFRLEFIQQHVPLMDAMTREHVNSCWVPNDEVKVYPRAGEHAFSLACRIFLDYSNSNPQQITKLAKPFFILAKGILTTPINFPGTPYYKAKKGANEVQEVVLDMIKQRRSELTAMSSPLKGDDVRNKDLLGQLLIAKDSNGQVYREEQIAGKIIGYLFGGFYTISSTISFLMMHLAQYPTVFEKVLQEQLGIAENRGQGELLGWADVQKMKYSWNVVRESMRLIPPASGGLNREAIVDFSFAGHNIPKGWKVSWSTYSTNKDPKYFRDPEKFDPSRFEEEGPAPYTYLPFGAGPRMCKGNEYARMLILVYMHNVVTKFRLEKINPQEKIYYSPDPVPAEGARILIRPLN